MADRSGYIGRAPGDSSVTVARQTFSPTGITTDFTFESGYTPGYFDIFINGAKMIEGSDYTSTDGSTFVILNGGAISGDVIEGVAYKAFNAATATIGISSAGTPISTQANTLNFVGTGNTFALRGTTIDVSISGGAGAGGTWSNYDGVLGVTTTKKVKIQNNLEVTGVTTSTGGFVGNVTGNATGLTGTPNIIVGSVTGTTGSFSGNVSVGGTLTYEDVTNIDSLGIVTARTGIKVLAGGANIVGVTTAASGLVVSSGGINIVGGGATVAGIATFHDGADIEGFKVEDGQTAATPNGEFNFYLASGHFFRYTGTPGADYYPNFKHSASINLNDRMDVNDVVTATLAVNSPAVTYHIANTIHIDGNATGENSYTIDTDWVGGSAPDAGNGSGYDIYSFTIIKTADKNFTILANALAAA